MSSNVLQSYFNFLKFVPRVAQFLLPWNRECRSLNYDKDKCSLLSAWLVESSSWNKSNLDKRSAKDMMLASKKREASLTFPTVGGKLRCPRGGRRRCVHVLEELHEENAERLDRTAGDQNVHQHRTEQHQPGVAAVRRDPLVLVLISLREEFLALVGKFH